jgi:hypothetical protein
LLDINIEDVATDLVIFEPIDNILAACAVKPTRVRVSIFLAIASHIVIVQLHYFLMQLLVQVLRYKRVLIIKVVLLYELTDEIGPGWNLSFCPSYQELQDMLVRLLVLFTVVL